MNSVDPKPISVGSESRQAPLPFSKHGVILATSISELRKYVNSFQTSDAQRLSRESMSPVVLTACIGRNVAEASSINATAASDLDGFIRATCLSRRVSNVLECLPATGHWSPCMGGTVSVSSGISQLLEVRLDMLRHQVATHRKELWILSECHGFRSLGDAVHG